MKAKQATEKAFWAFKNQLFLDGYAITKIDNCEEATRLIKECGGHLCGEADAEYFPHTARPYPNKAMSLLTDIEKWLLDTENN